MAQRFSNITFNDPYFALSFPQRLVAKAIAAAVLASMLAIALIFITDNDPRRRAFALLILLFLGDLLIQRIRGERQITGQLIEELSRGKTMNVAQHFRASAKGVLEQAIQSAEIERGAPLILFIIKELADTPEIVYGFTRLGIERRKFLNELVNKIESVQPEIGACSDNKERKKAMLEEISALGKAAFEEAAAFGETNVSPTALFLGTLNLNSPHLAEFFARFNFSATDFRNAVILGRLARGLGMRMARRRAAVGRKKITHRVINRAWTSRPTPTLDQFSEDLTALARKNLIGFMVGHHDKYRTLINTLARTAKNNALLVGAEGVGKDTIVGHLAFQITRDEIPPKLFDRRLVKLSITSLTSNIKSPGELQARIEAIVNEIILAGNIVLYLPDIHALKLTTAGQGLSAFDTLKPIFQASLIPTVGASNPQSYRTIIEQDTDFKVLFDKIDVPELSPDEALTLLTYESWLLEACEQITISYPALRKTVELAHRYLRQKPLPASAVDLLHEAIAETKNRREKVLTETIVAEIVGYKTKIPVERPKEREVELLLNLEEKIHERLINQEEAVRQVASAMRQYRAGLAREKGPIATFLFAGPTGVGKTELAKTLAEIYFGGESDLVRFDMSEYKDTKSIWNFIGSPDGAVSGALIEAIKAKPFAVLLLDEFEKAHKDILELFLPIFDEGYATSSLGERVDLKSMIIIATSNAHSNLIKTEVEKGTPFEEIVALLKKRLTEYFKPELINRFDTIIAFRQLTEKEIEKIAKLQLGALVRRLAEDQGIIINIDSSVAPHIAKLGWDPVYGARPLRGVIREQIRETLAQKILKNDLTRGSRATIALKDGAITIE